MLLMEKVVTSLVVAQREKKDLNTRHAALHLVLVKSEVKESLGVRNLKKEKNK